MVKGICFPDSSDCKESTCNSGDVGSIPRSGSSPGEGHGYPLQYSCLENSMDRGAWQTTVHGVAKSDTTEQLSLALLFKGDILQEKACRTIRGRVSA